VDEGEEDAGGVDDCWSGLFVLDNGVVSWDGVVCVGERDEKDGLDWDGEVGWWGMKRLVGGGWRVSAWVWRSGG